MTYVVVLIVLGCAVAIVLGIFLDRIIEMLDDGE